MWVYLPLCCSSMYASASGFTPYVQDGGGYYKRKAAWMRIWRTRKGSVPPQNGIKTKLIICKGINLSSTMTMFTNYYQQIIFPQPWKFSRQEHNQANTVGDTAVKPNTTTKTDTSILNHPVEQHQARTAYIINRRPISWGNLRWVSVENDPLTHHNVWARQLWLLTILRAQDCSVRIGHRMRPEARGEEPQARKRTAHRAIVQDKISGSCALNIGHSYRTVSRV